MSEDFYDRHGKKWVITGESGLGAAEPAPPPAPEPKPNPKRKYERRIFMTKQYSISELLIEQLKALSASGEKLPPMPLAVLTVLLDKSLGNKIPTTVIRHKLEPFFKSSGFWAAISTVGKYMVENNLATRKKHQPHAGKGYNVYYVDEGIQTEDPEAVMMVYRDFRDHINREKAAKRAGVAKPEPKPAPVTRSLHNPEPPPTDFEELLDRVNQLDKTVANLNEVIKKINAEYGDEVGRVSHRLFVLEKEAKSDLTDKARSHITGIWDAIEDLRSDIKGLYAEDVAQVSGNRQVLDINVNFRLGGGDQ